MIIGFLMASSLLRGVSPCEYADMYRNGRYFLAWRHLFRHRLDLALLPKERLRT
jgi:hypothetical protein